MGPYIKYDRNLGGRGGWRIAVSIRNSDVMLFSNNDICSQGGGGGQKRPKNAVILNVWPLAVKGNSQIHHQSVVTNLTCSSFELVNVLRESSIFLYLLSYVGLENHPVSF